jgi:ribonuclease HI
MEITSVYTDGSSRGNPGPGGWAAIIVGDHTVRELGGREERTTNNRMEMLAAIEALKSLPSDSNAPTFQSESRSKGVGIEIYTDSEYLLNGITKWIFAWQANGWKTKNKKEVLNQDLWERLLSEVEKRNLDWQKVEGHSGHKLNDRCDEIATGFADNKKVILFNGEKKNYQKN